MDAPVTPLGARTPHAHPALRPAVISLSVIAAVGIYLAAAWSLGWWPLSPAAAPSPSPSPSASPAGVEYRNDRFGLLVKLPDSWRGFTVVTGQEDAVEVASGTIADSFPRISIRHPTHTDAAPRQDLPIFVFTLGQWAHVGQPGENEWSVSAAPIPPSELARNTLYVFALPARYNYAFPEGWEEVQAIVDSGAVTAFEPGSLEEPEDL
jgi:hypothetical protein